MRVNEHFFEIHNNLPREGPGDSRSTRRAYRMLTDLPERPRVLDVGCGSGVQTIELAKISNVEITALDIHQPFLDVLAGRAKVEGVSERIRLVRGDMLCLDFECNSFDVIWCEGAIFVVGFEKGLCEWRRFLVDKGYFVVSELCWIDPNPPRDVKEYMLNVLYPSVKTVAENLRIIRDVGYEVKDYFVLPESSWWENYYLPILAKLPFLKRKYQGSSEALGAIVEEEKEIEIFRRYSKHYGYVFYSLQKV
ncbi:MAG: class I SAM-dependent methyltransferase [Candidatus Bathyarchaeota archaeon]|nr:class I SAM-dependent methyltransferase [Candidatus Termiticorpusculum sp.]MCL1970988.1 class I SAM-dependent methyltransferase [Candidatus Termiticorpusculum sp.]